MRLRHVAEINPSTPEFDLLAEDEPVTFLPLEAVWPSGGLDVSRTRPKGEVSSGYTRFREDDILAPKITPTFEADRSTIARGLRRDIGAGTTELHVIRPGPNLDVRYANYLVSSRPFLQGGEAAMKGVAGQQRVPDEWLRDFHVPVTDRMRQRAIADFLDTETVRIDALIAKKRRMIDLLKSRRTRVLEELFADAGLILPVTVDPVALDSVVRPVGWRVIRLSQVLRQLTNGYVGPTRDILQPDGVPYIQSLHIKRGRIDFDRRPYYVSPEWHAARQRIALRPNDVLIVQTGDIGQVALVPELIGEASCHALLIARVNRDVISGPYLAAYLQSHLGYHSLLRMATGALHPHLESSIKEVRIIVPPIEFQDELVCEMERRQALLDQAADRLGQQIWLLLEHRQALITAAVTGQLEVPGTVTS